MKYAIGSNIIIRTIKSEENIDNFLHSFINNNFDGDILSEGDKILGIEEGRNLIGAISLKLAKPSIYLDALILPKYDNRKIVTDVLLTIVKYLHNIYKHRNIIVKSRKNDYAHRQVIEYLGFKRVEIDKENGIYIYNIFVPNPNKEK